MRASKIIAPNPTRTKASIRIIPPIEASVRQAGGAAAKSEPAGDYSADGITSTHTVAMFAQEACGNEQHI